MYPRPLPLLIALAACSTPVNEAQPPKTASRNKATRAVAPPTVTPKPLPSPEPSPTAAPSPTAETTPSPASLPVSKAEPARPPPEPPPLPRGTTVVHFGDSMADALGKDLKRELEKREIRNIVKFKEATYIPQWAAFKMGWRPLVAWFKPDLVIITLGGNEVAMPDPTIRIGAIKRLVKAVGDRPCVWVGAPLWPGSPNSGILEVIRNNCAPCRYVDTTTLLPDLKRLPDNVHPTLAERRRWARFMVRWLRYNRDPQGERPWTLTEQPVVPPPPRTEVTPAAE